jgi:hypothetical protein
MGGGSECASACTLLHHVFTASCCLLHPQALFATPLSSEYDVQMLACRCRELASICRRSHNRLASGSAGKHSRHSWDHHKAAARLRKHCLAAVRFAHCCTCLDTLCAALNTICVYDGNQTAQLCLNVIGAGRVPQPNSTFGTVSASRSHLTPDHTPTFSPRSALALNMHGCIQLVCCASYTQLDCLHSNNCL